MNDGIGIEGASALGEALKKFVDQFAGHEARMLRVLGVGLLEVTKDHFDQEQDPFGQAWPKSRRAQGQGAQGRVKKGQPASGGKTLQDSRILFNSLSWTLDGSGNLVVGSPLEYAAIHNFGGEIRPRPGSGKRALRFGKTPVARVVMPKRQFLGWGPGEINQVHSDLAALAKGLAKGGT